jgi:phage tail-like protein
MAITSAQMASSYPIPTYRFIVSVGSEDIPFNNVSGLNVAYDTIEYKDGLGNWYKMPGQLQAVEISLKKGVFPGDSKLYKWINQIAQNKLEKKDLTISLTDTSGSNPLMTWTVDNAFPKSMTSPSLDANSNEIAVEELSLMADRVTLSMAS